MTKEYIINEKTVVVMSVSNSCCKIYEVDNSFEVNMSLNKILELSCNYYGCSFNGRLSGSRYHIGYDYKLPIIVDDYKKIIMFPIKSYRSENNCLISLNKVKDFDKNDKGFDIYIGFNKKIEINDSYKNFEKQYLKATKLMLRIERIKNTSF